jgi:sporulation protein YlmC with PRC-barrel domain
MLYRMEKLIGMSIAASDGEVGRVKDVYFDDHQWAARYLVVQTGGWLEDRGLSLILCVRHRMTSRSIYAEEEDQCGASRRGGVAVHPQGAD